jgi:hypothetical protein
MRVRSRKVQIIQVAILLEASLLVPAVAQTNWELLNTFHIGGQGGWDYLTPDSRTHRLYVPRTTHTLVIDEASGKVLADIPGQKNAHGVALAPKAGRGFISDGGGEGAIVIFDLKTNEVLGKLTAMEDADGIIFDSGTDQVLCVSGRGKALMMFKPDIDPKNGKLGEPIPLHGEPEFLAADEKGKAFINLMTTDEVAEVDLKAKRVLANWSVAPGGKPVGMAIDRGKSRIFIGCRGPEKLIVMSTKDGKVISDMPIGSSVDAVKFDRGQAFASTAGSQLFVAGETSPGKFEIVQTVKTGEGARTMALDSSAQKIYLPAADYESRPNGKKAVKPDSFVILVVGRPGGK